MITSKNNSVSVIILFAALAALIISGTVKLSAQDGTWLAASGSNTEPNPKWLWSDSARWVDGIIAGSVGTTTSTATAFFPQNVWNWTDVDDGRNVQFIDHGVSQHTHAMTGSGWLHLTNGGAIRGAAQRIQYFTNIQLEGGSGGSYRFLESTGRMELLGTVRGTAATSGVYTLTLGGSHNDSFVGAAARLQNGSSGGVLNVVVDTVGRWRFLSNDKTGTYTGTTTLRQGIMEVAHQAGLGNSSGIVVSDALTSINANLELRLFPTGTGANAMAYAITVNNHNANGNTVIVNPANGGREWSGNITLNRNIELQAGDTTGRWLDLTGVISGAGGFVQTRVGPVRLHSANTFSGTVRVNDATGTLDLRNVLALQNATLDVGGAGAYVFGVAGTNTYTLGGLAGTGSLNAGANSLNVKGISPGSSPGLIAVTANTVTLSGLSTFDINGSARGTQYDAVDLTGNIIYGGDLLVNIGFSPNAGDTFLLFDVSGSRSGMFANITFSDPFYNGSTFDPNTGVLTVIPEPGSVAMIMGLGAFMLVFQRRLRRKQA